MIKNSIKREAREEGLKEGKKEGIKEGIKEGKIEIAKNLLNMGMSLEDISKATSLTTQELSKLKEQ
ncbi:MAG: hypothetical protein J6G98_02325 [Bacilli bacterium]|nr:hypothetical protein [Bacilli bacterium]